MQGMAIKKISGMSKLINFQIRYICMDATTNSEEH